MTDLTAILAALRAELDEDARVRQVRCSRADLGGWASRNRDALDSRREAIVRALLDVADAAAAGPHRLSMNDALAALEAAAMTAIEFLFAAEKARHAYPEWRHGQTLFNDAALHFAMLANTKYSIFGMIIYDTGATPDFKFDITGPTSPTLVYISAQGIAAGGT